MEDRTVLLLGCGPVGLAVATLLGRDRTVDRVIAADNSQERATAAAEACSDKSVAVRLDHKDDESLNRVLSDVNLAINTLRLPLDSLLPLMRSVVEAGVSYVDCNDDPESLQTVFDSEYLFALAGHRAVGVVPGLGASPGQTNTMAQYLSQRLDRTEEVRLFHVDDLRHRSHDQWRTRLSAFGTPALVWRDNDWTHVAPMSEWEDVTFASPWSGTRCYIVGAQPVTLPVSMPTLTELAGYRGLSDAESEETVLNLVRYGLASEHPVETEDGAISPAEFAAAYFSGPWSPFQAARGEPTGLPRQMQVSGRLQGRKTRFTLTWWFPEESESQSTAAPLAVGARMLLRRELPAPGLYPPEGLDPAPFLWDMERRGVEIHLAKTVEE